jgi:2-C-methyl-D-erythritol 4-phosphate cytidylyltransferase
MEHEGRVPDEVWAIVLGAGSATRFGGNKQFAVLGGARLIDRAVDAASAVCDGVIVVLPAGASWNHRTAAAVPGGATRAASVRCGLAAIPQSADIVVVHDAAHPLAGQGLFTSVIAKVRAGADAATLAIPSAETFARVRDGFVLATEPRQTFWITQTPHAFRAAVLRAAHTGTPETTDDIALLVAQGRRVTIAPGDPRNIHITTPDELELARRLVD